MKVCFRSEYQKLPKPTKITAKIGSESKQFNDIEVEVEQSYVRRGLGNV